MAEDTNQDDASKKPEPTGVPSPAEATAPASPAESQTPGAAIPEGVVASATPDGSNPAEHKQGDQVGTADNPPIEGAPAVPGVDRNSTPGAARPAGGGGRGRMQGGSGGTGGGGAGGGGGRSGGGRDSRGGGRAGGRNRGRDSGRESDDSIETSVIKIYRCAKVVKGGRTFSFAALVVAGDRAGKIGIGYGKANEVPSAVEKATKEARAGMFTVPLKGTTIPHKIRGKTGASEVILVPALPGTGVTAGKVVRPALELAGITDILTKTYGAESAKNVLKATIDALKRLRTKESVREFRGVELPEGAGELVAG